jgi:hypothetical protein
MEHEFKSLSFELNAADDGAFSATFSTLNVVDLHGDVTVPGAFQTGAEVLIGAYQHDLFALPVGKGTIRADEDRAWVEGSFFLDTQPGADTYRTVKAAGGLMEWSYVFQVTDSEQGEFESPDGKTQPVRFLKAVDVWSVDPVLKGAGIGTRTDAIKSAPMPFADEASALRVSANAFVTRSRSLAELRAKEGRTLSTANADRLSAIAGQLRESAEAIDALLTEASPQKSSADLQREFLTFQRTLAVAGGILLQPTR